MLRYLGVRAATSLAVLLGVSTLVFAILHAVPGDPADSILGDTASAEEKEELRRCLELDEPLIVQYGIFLRNIGDLSLGWADCSRTTTVRELVAEVFPATLALALAAMLVAVLLAIPLGILAALRANTFVDDAASTLSLVGLAAHSAWLGPALIIVFAIELRWFPPPGAPTGSLSALVLPAVTLGTALMAMLSRITRSSMLEVMREDYVRTARSKGLPERVVVLKHALRNALIPVVTIGGLQFGALLAGAIITEKVFARPGIGTLLLEGIEQRNYPIVQGCVLAIAVSYVVINLVTDLAYAAIDPRVRLARSREPASA